MREILHDPMGIYAIAFGIFIILAYVYGAKPALAWVDGEIGKIRAELDAAFALRAEAEAALEECKAKQARAEIEAKEILETAKDQVAEMRSRAERDLVAALARHEQLSSERIRLAENQAIEDVRLMAITLAMGIARKTATFGLAKTEMSHLLDLSIQEIPAIRNEKSRAA